MTAELDTPETLAEKLAPLLEVGVAPLAELGVDPETLQELGFEVSGDQVRIPRDVERLDESTIRDALSERARNWAGDLATLEVVGSTSTLINDLAMRQSVSGVVRLAELQVQGRGRRGRGWQSPYANNLAMSVGALLPQKADALGGFSLCVGLAVADQLQTLGIEGVALKWPNDVLIRGQKVAGILIELHSRPHGTETVTGIGLNFHLPEAVKAAIDQPVTDLAATGASYSRNMVAAGLLSSLVDFVEGFAAEGFAPMREVFNRQHWYHDRSCTLITGRDSRTGIVRGVGNNGELLMEMAGGVEAFSSGEVSLRPA